MQRLSGAALLPLLASSLFAQGTPEAVEPNNTSATAAVLLAGAQGFGAIDTTGTDEDWFKITLPAARDLLIWTGPGFAGQIGDTRVKLIASDGVTVLADVDDGNNTTHGYYSVFASGNLPAGDVYVAVRGYDNVTFGSYTLDVVAAPVGTYVANVSLAPLAESPEENDPRRTGGVATTSVVFSRNSGNINAIGAGTTSFTDPVADYDFYAFTATATGTYTFSTLATTTLPTAGRCNDTVVRLVDSAFVSLAFNDDFGGGGWSQFTFNITTPGTYYAVVRTYGSATFGVLGNYLLDIVAPTPPLPTGAATVTMQTGGCAGTAGTPALGNRVSSTHANVRPELLVLGSTFYLDGTGMPASAPHIQIIGLTALAPPFDLGSLGAPGCLIEVAAAATTFAIADPTGVSFWGIASPANVVFIGLPIEQQLAVLDAGANALGVSVSNRVSSVCGINH